MRTNPLLKVLFSRTSILSLAGISVAQALDPKFSQIRLEINRKARPDAKQLPSFSKVELLKEKNQR